MSEPQAPIQKPRLLEAILLSLAFALAHTQSPLYFSNQNQYFLHGLANAGLGHLSHDWLANTADPTPVFSALVALGYRDLGEGSFQAAFFLLLMAYFLSMRWLVSALPGIPNTRSFRLAWAAGFIAAHAAMLRVAAVKLTGFDYPWFFQCGVAGQYLLGPGLQPSVFGVLLVTGLAAFANRRPVLAAALTASACIFHSTYLLPAGLLVLGYLAAMMRDGSRNGPSAFAALLVASIIAMPVAVYTLFKFGSPNAHTFETAQRILAEVRIPHHCIIARWFDEIAAIQLAWIAVGLVLLRRSPLFVVLLLASIIGVVLTFLQYESGNPTFALMFPWRISAVLVPVATAVIVAKLAALLPKSPVVIAISSAAVIALAAGGAWVMAAGMGYHSGEDEEPLYEYVRTHAGPDDVYLLPVHFPAVGTGRGSMSATFTPPPRPDPESNLIPVDLQRFRLHTGTCIYVDFKSVPYRDVEVLEWRERMRRCETWYDGDWSASGRVQELHREGVTHVVTPAGKLLVADYLEEVHSDPAYVVYRVK